ncbi:PDZ domain-containing protein [Streptomyces sp. RKND-216]|uniref:S41 family peptidase n=1 Tax=Streptomyces sp. RKND-216 TaxID=2562581 RepID=UPI00109E20AE|nr:S41 family peptidase [Streptomyces sp. RKND-216]THA26155.1 PDZ domain-containing protein [Streptomyces sp. RKND-216]
MSGTWRNAPPRRVRRGAALTLVFAGALATGAATNSWGGVPGGPGAPGVPGPRHELNGAAGRTPGGAGAVPAEAAEAAEAKVAAEELVSRSGDRWEAAYSAHEYEGFERRMGGAYVGVGVSVKRSDVPGGDEVVRVEDVLPDSPADRAGLRPGDRLQAVDGVPVTGEPVTEVVALLRGAADASPGRAADPGTAVDLTLSRGGHQWSETLKRARLAAASVSVSQPSPRVTRIEIASFTEGVGARVRRAVAEAPEGSGFLLDLRGNSGGLVAEATESASAFLDGGLVATYDYDDEQQALYAEGTGNTAAPLVVLVDGGTMSAAELLTGALQDRGRAVVVGSRTFGKGSVQVPHRMPDGSVAELTVGHYSTPSGRRVHGRGLLPDLEVRSGDRAAERARRVLSGLAAGS